MANPFSNKKKVRGWKRRIRQLERLRLEHRQLDVAALREHGVQYVQIWLDPWDRLVQRNPPYWYRRRILAAFIDIFGAWKTGLEELGEPYYLELWLFEPDFYRTQVVAAVGTRVEYYRTLFPTVPGAPGRPPPQYQDPAYALSSFRWRAGEVIDVRTEKLDEPDAQDIATWSRHAARIEHTADDTLYIFNRGIVWLGSQPADTPP
ncbi:MAG TPA: hypothetical protein VHG08_04185 [Longimicrobium sp.]|nr:hypothetical protein [Longimicrobium sp.]